MKCSAWSCARKSSNAQLMKAIISITWWASKEVQAYIQSWQIVMQSFSQVFVHELSWWPPNMKIPSLCSCKNISQVFAYEGSWQYLRVPWGVRNCDNWVFINLVWCFWNHPLLSNYQDLQVKYSYVVTYRGRWNWSVFLANPKIGKFSIDLLSCIIFRIVFFLEF